MSAQGGGGYHFPSVFQTVAPSARTGHVPLVFTALPETHPIHAALRRWLVANDAAARPTWPLLQQPPRPAAGDESLSVEEEDKPKQREPPPPELGTYDSQQVVRDLRWMATRLRLPSLMIQQPASARFGALATADDDDLVQKWEGQWRYKSSMDLRTMRSLLGLPESDLRAADHGIVALCMTLLEGWNPQWLRRLPPSESSKTPPPNQYARDAALYFRRAAEIVAIVRASGTADALFNAARRCVV